MKRILFLLMAVLMVVGFSPIGETQTAEAANSEWYYTEWCFTAAGFFPTHLPDACTQEVDLAALDLGSVPDEIQGVWYFGPTDSWIFWIPGVGGELITLQGGMVADYMVLVNGACCWTISPLLNK